MIILDLFKLIFDKKHVKDIRNWILVILVASFYSYHLLIVKPVMDRQDRQGLRIRQIITVGKFRERMDALPKETR